MYEVDVRSVNGIRGSRPLIPHHARPHSARFAESKGEADHPRS